MSEESAPAPDQRTWRQKVHLQGWRLWLLVAVVAYTLIGFLLLPWLVRNQAPKMAAETAGIDLAIERVRFNPYTFTVSVEGLNAGDPDTGELLSFDRLFVDFEPFKSLWNRAWTVRDILLDGPAGRVVRFADGSTNFSRVIDRLPEDDTPEPETDGPPPRLTLSHVALTDGRAVFIDRTRPEPWTLELGPVSFALDGFGTLTGQQGQYRFEATTAQGGHTVWDGSLAVAPFRSEGSLGLRNIELADFYSYVGDQFDAELAGGGMNVSTRYRVDTSGPELLLTLSEGVLDVNGLKLVRGSSGEDLVEVPEMSATGISFDLQSEALDVKAVEVLGPVVNARRLENGEIDLAAAFAAPSGSPETAATEDQQDDAGAQAGQEAAQEAAVPDGDETAGPEAAPEAPAAGAAAGDPGDAGDAGTATEEADAPAAGAGGTDSEATGQAAEDPAPGGGSRDGDTDPATAGGGEGASGTESPGQPAGEAPREEDPTAASPGSTASGEPSAEDAAAGNGMTEPAPAEPAAEDADAGAESPPAPAGAPAADGSFAVRVAAVEVQEGRVTFQDRAAPGPVDLSLENIRLAISDYDSTQGHRADLSLSATGGRGGDLTASGTVRGAPLEVGLDVKTTAFSLVPFTPYLVDVLNLDIQSINAEADGRITVTEEEPFGFRGTVGVMDFSSRLPGEEEELVSWSRLAADSVDVSLASNRVKVATVTLGKPFARVRISEQGEFNLARIVPPREDGAQDGDAAQGAPEDATEDAGEPMAIAVGQVNLIQGSMDFRDLSLPLPFEAMVDSMKGTVSAISSGSPTPAKVEIDGNVNEYGSSTIRGTVDLFDPTRLMDLAVDFRNIEMPNLTPYTMKFAGRRIADGRMDVDLTWKIRNSQLEATNRMVLERLELGEKVDVPGAMNLPLDLAVALLTDSQGKIDLDVPVTGDLDNPEFSYAPLVFKALGNILANIVTAPFRFLASLAGADADEAELEFVGFVAGDAKLLGPEQEDLNLLAQALAQRPELGLSVAAAYDAEADREALQEDRLDAEVSRRFETGQNDSSDGDPVRGILEAMYTEARGAEALAALAAANTAVPEGQSEPVLDEPAYLAALREELISLQTVFPTELEALGGARGDAVKEYLVTTGGIDAGRITVATPAPAERADENLVYVKLDVATP
ncbi:MAG: DUF748 domain-containing protein [Gammaproteobacteria bacterium]